MLPDRIDAQSVSPFKQRGSNVTPNYEVHPRSTGDEFLSEVARSATMEDCYSNTTYDLPTIKGRD